MLTRRTSRRRHAARLVALTVAVTLAGCTSERTTIPPASTATTSATPSATSPGTVGGGGGVTTVPPPATVVATTVIAPLDTTAAPSTTVPAELPVLTVVAEPDRGRVAAMDGADGADGHGGGLRFPELPVELGPLPNPFPAAAALDPEAVGAQWVAVKLLTSGRFDGPLWPYSVDRHLLALSDPTGQYLPDATVTAAHTSNLAYPDPSTALVDVDVDLVDLEGRAWTYSYHLTLWRADRGGWLVAFAELVSRR